MRGPSLTQKAEGPKSYSFIHSLIHSFSKYLFDRLLSVHQGMGQAPSLLLWSFYSNRKRQKKKKERKETTE